MQFFVTIKQCELYVFLYFQVSELNFYCGVWWVIFMQLTSNLLRITQEVIIHRVSKIHEWILEDVYEWGKVS